MALSELTTFTGITDSYFSPPVAYIEPSSTLKARYVWLDFSMFYGSDIWYLPSNISDSRQDMMTCSAFTEYTTLSTFIET